MAQRQTGVQSAEQGVVTGGKLKEPPQSLRSHAQLRQDHTKTGVSVPDDLPQCFPRGPWSVNLSSDPDASDGWRYVEVQMHNSLRAWSSDPATPRASDEARWRKGGFVLKGVTRSKASGKQGTRKEMQCQGRELGDKGVMDRHKCGFKVTLEFVARVDDGDSPGWVYKKVEGGLHERESDGNMHQLTRTTWEAQADAVLSGGNSQLSSDPYHSFGFTLKHTGLGATTIDHALRQKAVEQGDQPRWHERERGRVCAHATNRASEQERANTSLDF